MTTSYCSPSSTLKRRGRSKPNRVPTTGVGTRMRFSDSGQTVAESTPNPLLQQFDRQHCGTVTRIKLLKGKVLAVDTTTVFLGSEDRRRGCGIDLACHWPTLPAPVLT